MKKSLILSAALVAALGMKAEVFNYDFNSNPKFFSILYAPEEEGGWAHSGEYDIVDKKGSAINTDGTAFTEQGADGEWHAVKNLAIDLNDGLTYTLSGNLTIGENEFTPIDMTHPFLCWDQEGKGPSRVHIFNSWNSPLDDNKNYVGYKDKDYGAASADDYIDSKGAIGFLRNSNSGSRTGTFIQFPPVVNPTKVTLWIGNQGGKYHEMGLYAEVVPVINGVAGDVIPVKGPDDYVAKRYYKVETTLPASVAGDVAFRIGCGGSQVQIYHIAIEAEKASSGIEDIIAAPADENAPIYNVMGVQVDENYKGIVIKNGKKYVQK